MTEKINAGHAKARRLVAYPSRNGGTAHGRLLASRIDPEVSSSRGATSVVAPLVPTGPRGAPMRDDVCSIDGCDSTTFARGWCNAHYKRWKRHGDPTAPRQARTLAECAPIIDGDTARVPLTRGLYAVIDAADAEAVGTRIWQAEPAGLTHYAQTNRAGNRPATRLHRFVLGFGPGDPEVDHIDGDGLNCRRSNLRATTRTQNQANRAGRRGTSTYKGVRWDNHRSAWAVEIKDSGRARFLGRFADEIEAAQAYDQAAVEAWGEYARLKLPGRRHGGGGPVSAPTTGDAIRRRLASFPNKHGGRSLGRLIYVGKGRATLRLPSGAHVTVRREDVQVLLEAPRAVPG